MISVDIAEFEANVQEYIQKAVATGVLLTRDGQVIAKVLPPTEIDHKINDLNSLCGIIPPEAALTKDEIAEMRCQDYLNIGKDDQDER